jgi:hypothetical protein
LLASACLRYPIHNKMGVTISKVESWFTKLFGGRKTKNTSTSLCSPKHSAPQPERLVGTETTAFIQDGRTVMIWSPGSEKSWWNNDTFRRWTLKRPNRVLGVTQKGAYPGIHWGRDEKCGPYGVLLPQPEVLDDPLYPRTKSMRARIQGLRESPLVKA